MKLQANHACSHIELFRTAQAKKQRGACDSHRPIARRAFQESVSLRTSVASSCLPPSIRFISRRLTAEAAPLALRTVRSLRTPQSPSSASTSAATEIVTSYHCRAARRFWYHPLLDSQPLAHPMHYPHPSLLHPVGSQLPQVLRSVRSSQSAFRFWLLFELRQKIKRQSVVEVPSDAKPHELKPKHD